MSSEDIEIKAYMDQKEADNFIGVKKELGDSYVIYWFVWKRDGIFPWPDWEPVVVVFRRQQLECVSVRRHFRWEEYRAEELVRPVTVYFDGLHHAPYVKTTANERKFDRLVSKGVVPVPLDRSIDEEVPDFARDSRRLLIQDYWIQDYLKRYPGLLERLLETMERLTPTILAQKTVDDWIKELLKRLSKVEVQGPP